MGPTDPMGPAPEVWREDGESPGDEVEVTGGSGKPALIAELGEEVLFARDGDCRLDAASEVGPAGGVRPNGSTPRGEPPRMPADEGAPAV